MHARVCACVFPQLALSRGTGTAHDTVPRRVDLSDPSHVQVAQALVRSTLKAVLRLLQPEAAWQQNGLGSVPDGRAD